MTTVMNFFQIHPADAILITIIILVIAVLFVTGKKSALKKAALVAVDIAEDDFKKSKYGLIKKAQVVTYLRRAFPIVTAFIPNKILEMIIQEAFEIAVTVWSKAKESLQDDKDEKKPPNK